MDLEVPLLQIERLEYEEGRGLEQPDPLKRAFIKPSDESFTTDWLTLVSGELIRHGPFIKSFEMSSISVQEPWDIANFMICCFPWHFDKKNPEKYWWDALGIDVKLHRNIIETIINLANNNKVNWEINEDTKEEGKIGIQYIIGFLLSSAIMANIVYMNEQVSSPFPQ